MILKKVLLGIICCATVLNARAQKDSLDLRFSLNYSLFHALYPKGPGAIKFSTSFNYKFVELQLNTQYSFINHYTIETSFERMTMKDQFFSVGADLNFRLFSFKKDELFIGWHYFKHFLVNHHYKYENFNTDEVKEYNCSECPVLLASFPDYSFDKNYKWQIGFNVKYYHHFTKHFLINCSAEITYLNSLEYFGFGDGWWPASEFTWIPSIGFAYKIGLRKQGN